MRKPVKTLFQNGTLVSVRDYEVEGCIKRNDAMHIVFGDQTMTMDPDSLRDKKVLTSDIIPSSYGNKGYRLISYKWEPNIEFDD